MQLNMQITPTSYVVNEPTRILYPLKAALDIPSTNSVAILRFYYEMQ